MSEGAANPMQAAAFLRERNSPKKHHTQVSISFGERMDVGALRAAWEVVCGVHPVLKSQFTHTAIGGVTFQEASAATTTWREVDWQALNPEEIPDKWTELQNSDESEAFDPHSQVRITVILLPGGGTHYLLTLPGYLLDETSIGRVLLDWLVALDRPPAPVTPLVVPLANATAWTEILKPAQGPMKLIPRPPGRDSITESLAIGREESRAFLDSCKAHALDPRAALHFLWGLLLRRLGATGNVSLGLFEVPHNSGEAGFFENWLPVVHPWNSKDWVRDSQQAYDAVSNNAWISPASALTASPTPIALEHLETGFAWRGPEVRDQIQTAMPRWINFDAKIQRRAPDLMLLEVRSALQITLQIHARIENRLLIKDLLERLSGLMQSLDTLITKPIGQIPLLMPQEVRTLKQWSRGPEGLERPKDILEAFRHPVAKHPDHVAVRDGDYALTFRELDTLSDRLASYLAHAGLAEGWHVALFLSPSSWIAIALIGTWKAGNSCLALDPAAPPEWIESMLTSHDAGVVICDAASAPLLDSSARRRIVLDQEWDDLATGELPKPTLSPESPAAILPGHSDTPPPLIRALTHEMLVTAALEGARVLNFGASDSFLAHSAPGGGAFFDEWLLPILAGGSVCVADDDVLDPAATDTTHIRLTAPEWNNQAARWSREAENRPATTPGFVAVEYGTASEQSLAIWNSCTGNEGKTISFFSPAGLCGLGLAGAATAENGILLAGAPTPDVEMNVCDEDGQDVPPGFSGMLRMKFPGWKKIFPQGGRRGLDTGFRAWRNGKGLCHVEGDKSRFPDHSPAALHLRSHPGVFDALIGEHTWTLSAASVEGSRPVSEWPLTRAGWIDEAALPRPEIPAPQKAPLLAAQEPSHPIGPWKPVAILQKNKGISPSLVLVPTASGIPDTYQDFIAALGMGRRILGLTARGVSDAEACHTTIESAAAAWIQALTEEDPSLAFDLCGFGYGGLAALEMARQLATAQRRVPELILIGTHPPLLEKSTGWLSSMKNAFKRLSAEDRIEPFSALGEPARTHLAACFRYRFTPRDLRARIILPSDFSSDAADAWRAILPSARVEFVKCAWAEMLSFPSVKRLASILSAD